MFRDVFQRKKEIPSNTMVQCHSNNFQSKSSKISTNALSVCWAAFRLVDIICLFVKPYTLCTTQYKASLNLALLCVPQKSARMLTWQMSILLTLVLSLVLLDPVLGDDQAPRLSVYPPVPGLEPSPYFGLRVREVS